MQVFNSIKAELSSQINDLTKLKKEVITCTTIMAMMIIVSLKMKITNMRLSRLHSNGQLNPNSLMI